MPDQAAAGALKSSMRVRVFGHDGVECERG